jgi:hypothetical protein
MSSLNLSDVFTSTARADSIPCYEILNKLNKNLTNYWKVNLLAVLHLFSVIEIQAKAKPSTCSTESYFLCCSNWVHNVAITG